MATHMHTLPAVRETPAHTLLLPQASPEAIEQALRIGDIRKMSPEIRVAYYIQTCLSIGLNPYTQPFDLIEGDDGTVKQYPNKSCAEQIRKRDQISLPVVSRVKDGDLYIVTVRATTPTGREEEAQGIVSLVKPVGTWKSAQGGSGKRYFEATRDAQGQAVYEPLRGNELANAMMKAETKAKRRATFGIAGLGFEDEEPRGTPVAMNLYTGALGAAQRPLLGPRAMDVQKSLTDHIEDLTGARPPTAVEEPSTMPQDAMEEGTHPSGPTEEKNTPEAPLEPLMPAARRHYLCSLVVQSQRALSEYIHAAGKRCKVIGITDPDAILAEISDAWIEGLITEAEAYLAQHAPWPAEDTSTAPSEEGLL